MCIGEGQGTSVEAGVHGRKVGCICGSQCTWDKGGVCLRGPVGMGEVKVGRV